MSCQRPAEQSRRVLESAGVPRSQSDAAFHSAGVVVRNVYYRFENGDPIPGAYVLIELHDPRYIKMAYRRGAVNLHEAAPYRQGLADLPESRRKCTYELKASEWVAFCEEAGVDSSRLTPLLAAGCSRVSHRMRVDRAIATCISSVTALYNPHCGEDQYTPAMTEEEIATVRDALFAVALGRGMIDRIRDFYPSEDDPTLLTPEGQEVDACLRARDRLYAALNRVQQALDATLQSARRSGRELT